MFVLAHISDIHLAPLPTPRITELMSKRGLGYLNWLRKRRAIHQREVLDAIVSDLKAHKPDHIAITGDLVNLSLSNEFEPARSWLEGLSTPSQASLVPGNHDLPGWRVWSIRPARLSGVSGAGGCPDSTG